MNLVLTSNLPSTPTEAVFHLMRSVSKRPRIAWIPPFEDVGHKRFLAARELFKAHGFDALEYYSIGKNRDHTQPRLEDYDIVYLSGGDPIRFRINLLQSSLASRLLNYLEEGRMIVAASGGSMQLTRNVSLFRLRNLRVSEVIAQHNEYEALGIVPYEFLPHLKEHDKEFLEKVRQYSERIDNDVVGVVDGGALLHKTREEFDCVGRTSIFRGGDVSFIDSNG